MTRHTSPRVTCRAPSTEKHHEFFQRLGRESIPCPWLQDNIDTWRCGSLWWDYKSTFLAGRTAWSLKPESLFEGFRSTALHIFFTILDWFVEWCTTCHSFKNSCWWRWFLVVTTIAMATGLAGFSPKTRLYSMLSKCGKLRLGGTVQDWLSEIIWRIGC